MREEGAEPIAQLHVSLDASGLEGTLRAFDSLEQESVRVVLVHVAPSPMGQSRTAEGLSSRFRASSKIVIGTLDGTYGAAGITLAAGADLVVGSEDTQLLLDTETVGFHPSWFPNLSLRDLKWLALCAGPLRARQLARSGFLNFVCARSEAASTAERLAWDVARVPGDVLTIKKRAHDTRHRLATTTGR